MLSANTFSLPWYRWDDTVNYECISIHNSIQWLTFPQIVIVVFFFIIAPKTKLKKCSPIWMNVTYCSLSLTSKSLSRLLLLSLVCGAYICLSFVRFLRILCFWFLVSPFQWTRFSVKESASESICFVNGGVDVRRCNRKKNSMYSYIYIELYKWMICNACCICLYSWLSFSQMSVSILSVVRISLHFSSFFLFFFLIKQFRWAIWLLTLLHSFPFINQDFSFCFYFLRSVSCCIVAGYFSMRWFPVSIPLQQNFYRKR